MNILKWVHMSYDATAHFQSTFVDVLNIYSQITGKDAIVKEPQIYNFFLGHLAETFSTAAASAVYAARSTLNEKPIWNDTLKLHTGYVESELVVWQSQAEGDIHEILFI